MNLTAICAASAFVLGAGSAYTLTSEHYGAKAAKQQQVAAEAYQARTVELNQVSAELERARNDRKTVYRTITKRVETYIDRPVYVRECVDDDGLRDINAALSGTANPGQPDATLPASGAAGGQDRR
jgi:hypothetical protein